MNHSMPRAVAAHFGTDHFRLDVEQPSLAIVDELAPLVDEPLADSSLLPAFLVSRLTRQHVTVALGGDGGDKLFGGYNEYRMALADQARFALLPMPLLRFAAAIAARIPAGIRGRNRIASLRAGALQQMIWGSPYFDIEMRETDTDARPDCAAGQRSRCARALVVELVRGRQRSCRCWSDPHSFRQRPHRRLSGQSRPRKHGVRSRRTLSLPRSPIDRILLCPRSRRVESARSRETRRLQKLLAKRMLPPTLDFNRKQGFSIPMDDWLRQERCATIRRYSEYLPTYIRRDARSN